MDPGKADARPQMTGCISIADAMTLSHNDSCKDLLHVSCLEKGDITTYKDGNTVCEVVVADAFECTRIFIYDEHKLTMLNVMISDCIVKTRFLIVTRMPDVFRSTKVDIPEHIEGKVKDLMGKVITVLEATTSPPKKPSVCSVEGVVVKTSKQPGSTGQVGQISEAVFKSGADETVSKLQDFDCTRQTKPDQSQTPNVSGGQPTLLHDAATSESVTTPDPGNITSNPVSMETTSKLSASSSLLLSTSLQDTQTQQNAILRPKIFKYRGTSKQPGSTGQVGQISEAVFKSGADETVSKLQDFDCTRQTKPDQSQTPNVSGGQPTLLHGRVSFEEER